MTVKELIEQLHKFDPELPVFGSDYTWGYYGITIIDLKEDIWDTDTSMRFKQAVMLS